MSYDKFFQDIASRYGISSSALLDAWNKTDSGVDHETHVKKFKLYLEKLTGEAHYNFDIPSIPDKLKEEIALRFLEAELDVISDEI